LNPPARSRGNPWGILAASHLGPEGYGNDLTGRTPWPAGLDDALRRGELAALHWSALFASDSQRFARMDLMSRLGLMSAELLDAGLARMPESERDRVGVCVETRVGCLATDLQFLQTPRPSVFPYTLPSAVLGEVCIRYRLRGPMLCLVSSGEPSAGVAEAVGWLEAGDAGAVLCLSVEALDAAATGLMSGLGERRSNGWHAAALWIGRRSGAGRECAVGSGTVESLSYGLCGAPAHSTEQHRR
jgi:hypothetical protein